MHDTGGSKMYIELTVCFSEPFWIGIVEVQDGNHMETAKIIFGSEPKDYEIYDFMLRNLGKLKFTRPLIVNPLLKKNLSPKRLQRMIKKEVENRGISTKAQLALKKEQEALKVERKKVCKERKEEFTDQRFQQKQEKKKQKKKGH
jgi:hypothetical protein